MPRLISILFSLALASAVAIGHQSRPWTWGPSLAFLALSTALALPRFIRNSHSSNHWFLAFCGVVAGWFALRGFASPVVDLKTADLLLLAAAVGAFLSMSVIVRDEKSDRIFLWTVWLLVVANVTVIAIQISDPSFNPDFSATITSVRASSVPSPLSWRPIPSHQIPTEPRGSFGGPERSPRGSGFISSVRAAGFWQAEAASRCCCCS
jgi:hypothetical protein